MPGGGAKPGERRGGRQKGTPNRATINRVEIIASQGITPLEFMLAVMRKDYAALDIPTKVVDGRVCAVDEAEEIHLALRETSAKDAAPYIHPKLHAIEHRARTAENEGQPMFSWLPPT